MKIIDFIKYIVLENKFCSFIKGLYCPEERRSLKKDFFEWFEAKRLNDIKLIMTLVVRNEEEIIEKNIRFHHAMGVDGFIVTNHNSTDKTLNILEKLLNEGLVLEIITEITEVHQRSIWVTKMIQLAKKKYKANWVINADADEFYYSKSLNLKKSILAVPCANVIFVYAHNLVPDNRSDFLNCPYFILNKVFRKVIHTTKNFRRIEDGNHGIYMSNQIEIESADIRLYHFNDQNYKNLEKKVKRWEKSLDTEAPGWEKASGIKALGGKSFHLFNLVRAYRLNMLPQYYKTLYNEENRNKRILSGDIIIDYSLSEFLKERNI